VLIHQTYRTYGYLNAEESIMEPLAEGRLTCGRSFERRRKAHKFDSGHENYSMSPQDFVAPPSDRELTADRALAQSEGNLSPRGLPRIAASEIPHRRNAVLALCRPPFKEK
jgi:hypothetical protein